MSASVKIDGHAIRSCREKKELTQLYLATVVGVTTDTISRWENRKYPSIKLENAQKLAEALDVKLEDILEKQSEGASEEKESIEVPAPELNLLYDKEHGATAPYKNKRILGGLGICLLLAAAIFYFFVSGKLKPPVITAERFLPRHTAPGLAFPVIIRLHADGFVDVPILIREEIKGKAIAKNIDQKKASFDHAPRWIGRLSKGENAFLYMVFPDQSVELGERIFFSGDCVSGKLKKSESRVGGNSEVNLARYHWADQDRNYQISDNEILDAYETFAISGDIEVDFTKLEEFWLAGHYYWNEKQRKLFPGAGNQ